MKLQCEVQVSNRLLSSCNLRKPARTTYAQLSIGRKPGNLSNNGQVFLMLCTAQNRSGTKYNILNNVENIFTKFVNEGKATVRLVNPTDDIAISKAEPRTLSVFLKWLRLASLGKECPDQVLSVLAPASAKHVEKPITSLHIDSPARYPLSFPNSLQQLTINNCSLRRMSSQITMLTDLRSLDMGSNQLTTVPSSVANLAHLHTLNLSDNRLTEFPLCLCSGSTTNSLSSLNLRNNLIQRLPAEISKLQALHTLNVSYNQITSIPECIAFMKMLRNILASDNQLEFLPGTLLYRRLETADFSNNQFLGQPPPDDNTSGALGVPTLRELAARTIVFLRIPYTSEDLDLHSLSYLGGAKFCWCLKPCFESSLTRLLSRKISSTICCGPDLFPCLVRFCSKTCYNRFL